MDLFQLKQEFAANHILICFNGPFSHSILEEIGVAIRNHLNHEDRTKAIITDVFSVYIELTQNARTYILNKNLDSEEHKSTIVVVARKQETYAVTSGNYVLNKDLPSLIERIEHLKKLGKDELKTLYKEQMRKPAQADGSVGLGLIEIARKSTRPVEYLIREAPGEVSFFSLTAFV